MILQSAMRILYPPACLSCRNPTTEDFALCGSCWKDLPLLSGACCDACAAPLVGEASKGPMFCDICLNAPRPWGRARAPLLYQGTARRLVLGFKHGDRQELARPMARWIKGVASDLISPRILIVPVPLHRFRYLKRRYNQAALLSGMLAELSCVEHGPDVLRRIKNTPPQEGMTRTERAHTQSGAFDVHPSRISLLKGRDILLVDDVMTSGATLAACSEACFDAGAATVNVVVLARVAWNP